MTKADGTAVTFAYDNKGLRLSKTVGDVTYRYTYNGGELVRIEDGTYTHNVRYDSSGQPMTIAYSGLEYFYVYNAQGDVVAIAKYDGTIVVEYAYDAWGKILSVTGEMAETLGKKNPFRYRGYVYDEETGLYYLKSRYYDPKVGRFICADGVLNTQKLLGSNKFSYCSNNPVIEYDPNGKSSIIIALILVGIAAALAGCSSNGADVIQVARPVEIRDSNCYGASLGLKGFDKNPGDVGGKSIVPMLSNKNVSTVKKAFDEALMADDEGSKAIVDVKLVDYTTKRTKGYRRIAAFYGPTLCKEDNFHFFWEEKPNEWYFVDGIDSPLFMTDYNGVIITDPREAYVGNDVASIFLGFYDVKVVE